MKEHELCCGTVANKARLCAEIERRDLRIKNLELCEDARARVAGRTLKFAMERGYNPASEENELEYIMRRFDDAEQIAAARLRRIDELVQARDAAEANAADFEAALDAVYAAMEALKAQWQAEAIDCAISDLSYCGCDGQAWASELEQYAIKLRAQEATNAPNP